MKDTKSYFPIYVKKATESEFNISEDLKIVRVDRSKFKEICGFKEFKFDNENKIVDFCFAEPLFQFENCYKFFYKFYNFFFSKKESKLSDEILSYTGKENGKELFPCERMGITAGVYEGIIRNSVLPSYVVELETNSSDNKLKMFVWRGVIWYKIRILNLALSLISPNSVTRALWGISERKEKPEVEELVSQNFIKRNLKEEVNSGNILELNEENVKKITLYYDKLYSHLCSSQSLLNEDEKIKMLTVLQLFSSSTFPWNIFYIEPFQFLQLVMALEMLLVPDGTDTRIKSKFSKRLAKLLGEQGQEKEIENKAKKIYSKRSNFVHNAKYFTANSQELLKIVEALQKAGKPLTFEEIVDKTSLKQEIAKNILCRMVKDGKIIKSDKNMYNLHENVIPEEISEQELFSKAQEYACKLVCKYITEPAIFSKENLKKCI